MPSNPGPAPVTSVVATEDRLPAAEKKYLQVVDALKADRGAEAKAIRAMFGNDKRLMDEFLAVAFSNLANNRDLLQRASLASIIQSLRDAASLGLRPDGLEGAITEYDGVAKFMPMYQGYKKRMLRSGKVMAVDAKAVFTEDDFDYETGPMGTLFHHHPAKARWENGVQVSTRGEWMGFYAYARTPDGFVYFRYMDVNDINRIRDTHGRTQTRSGKPLPWATDYEQMALKTVIRALAKDVPQEALGQEFIRVESENDAAIEQMKAASSALTDGLAEVRQLALAAVNQVPNEPPAPSQEEPGAEDGSRSAEEPTRVGQQVGTATLDEAHRQPDPDVAAAMRLAEEQEQLRRQRGDR